MKISVWRLLILEGFCVCAKLLQSCPTLCDPMGYSPPGSSVHEILQARIPEWVAVSSSRASSLSRNWTWVSYVFCIGRRVLYHWRHLRLTSRWTKLDTDLRFSLRATDPCPHLWSRWLLKSEQLFPLKFRKTENRAEGIFVPAERKAHISVIRRPRR